MYPVSGSTALLPRLKTNQIKQITLKKCKSIKKNVTPSKKPNIPLWKILIQIKKIWIHDDVRNFLKISLSFVSLNKTNSPHMVDSEKKCSLLPAGGEWEMGQTELKRQPDRDSWFSIAHHDTYWFVIMFPTFQRCWGLWKGTEGGGL